MPEKALIAMSGGVDSSAAAAIMLENGFLCEGVTLNLFESGKDSAANDAGKAAKKLGIAHNVIDFSEFFRGDVILPFIAAYENGLTPNPCIMCNRFIKFGRLFLEAAERDFNLLVTGHYAQIEKTESRYLLKKSSDQKKDQSYVLYGLRQEVLARCCFPLGNLSKNDARKIVFERGLAKQEIKESQDICFVPDGDYSAFIENYTGRHYPHGDILDTEGNVIGRHRGLIRYTLGQRRGLGVAANRPVYVCAKDNEKNTVTIGPESSLFSKSLTARNINLITVANLEKPMRVKVKTRYLQEEKSAWVEQTGIDEIRVRFDKAQRAITPGQSAVFYDGEYVVGGGIITARTAD